MAPKLTAPLLVGGDVLVEPLLDVLLPVVELFEELLEDAEDDEDEVVVVVLAFAADADEIRED